MVRQARHLAVGLHDFADHRRGREPGGLGEVAPGLGVPRPDEHAAVLGHHREDVAGLHDVAGLCMLATPCAPSGPRVGGRDAGAHAGGRLVDTVKAVPCGDRLSLTIGEGPAAGSVPRSA